MKDSKAVTTEKTQAVNDLVAADPEIKQKGLDLIQQAENAKTDEQKAKESFDAALAYTAKKLSAQKSAKHIFELKSA